MVIDRRGDQPTGGRSSIKTLTVNWPTTSAWTIWSSGSETGPDHPRRSGSLARHVETAGRANCSAIAGPSSE